MRKENVIAHRQYDTFRSRRKFAMTNALFGPEAGQCLTKHVALPSDRAKQEEEDPFTGCER